MGKRIGSGTLHYFDGLFLPPGGQLGQRDGAVPRPGPALSHQEAGPPGHHQAARQAHQDVPEVALRCYPAHQDRLQDDRGGGPGLGLTLL